MFALSVMPMASYNYESPISLLNISPDKGFYELHLPLPYAHCEVSYEFITM